MNKKKKIIAIIIVVLLIIGAFFAGLAVGGYFQKEEINTSETEKQEDNSAPIVQSPRPNLQMFAPSLGDVMMIGARCKITLLDSNINFTSEITYERTVEGFKCVKLIINDWDMTNDRSAVEEVYKEVIDDHMIKFGLKGDVAVTINLSTSTYTTENESRFFSFKVNEFAIQPLNSTEFTNISLRSND